ncbi:MAG: hypothetical protein GX365_05205, partial [Clostridiales bacterium]|nr:hypothetical protein [Clostridiales bacterium]
QNLIGEPEGIAALDEDGKVPLEQLPEDIGSGGVDTEARASIAQLESQFNDMAKLATSYGVVPDAKYFNEADKKWYADATYTTPATDNTVALQNALDAAAGSKLIIPPSCGIKGTVYIHSNTIVDGLGVGKVILLNGATLDSVVFRDTALAYPIVATEANSENITAKNFNIEGCRSDYVPQRQFGIGFVDTEHCRCENVHVSYINWFPEHAEGKVLGYGVATLRAIDIKIIGGSSHFCGYECYGIADGSRDIVCDKIYSRTGWRTSFQVHRDTKNIKLINSKIEEIYTDNHATITVHGNVDGGVENFIIDNCDIIEQGKISVTYPAIQLVSAYVTDMLITRCRIEAVTDGILVRGTKFKFSGNNKLICGRDAFMCSEISFASINENKNIIAGRYGARILQNVNNLEIDLNNIKSIGNSIVGENASVGVKITRNNIEAGDASNAGHIVKLSGEVHDKLIINDNIVKNYGQQCIAVDYRGDAIDNKMEICRNTIDAPATTYRGILVHSNYQNSIIKDNVILSAAVGIRLGLGTTGAIVTGNDVRRATTKIDDASTGTNTIENNYGVSA